jgi:hypothetical protein
VAIVADDRRSVVDHRAPHPVAVTMNSVISSTFFLTVLMVIGMGFFIRAAAKDRTQVVTLRSGDDGDQLLAALKQYFADRAYQVDRIPTATKSPSRAKSGPVSS